MAEAREPATEIAEDRHIGLDTWPGERILEALLEGQRRAVEAVQPAIPALARAAEIAAEKLAAGGRLIYLASGSPALVSLGDGLELPQTYGIARERIVFIFAGGHAITQNLTGTDEDDAEAARREVAALDVGAADCVIAVSASGSTPFTVAGLEAANSAGSATIGIAGNAGSPLLAAAGTAVFLDTGPEVISGSTRMGAGTAQKAALNMLSTLICVKLGHMHDGLMVNVTADNAKLRSRAARIVTRITGVTLEAALQALHVSDGRVKPAILIAAGMGDLAAAEDLLGQTRGNLRQALSRLAAS